jgi:hypothetical protein
VKWLDWCDGYQDDMCGYGCDMPVTKAYGFIRQQDARENLFSKKTIIDVPVGLGKTRGGEFKVTAE